MQRSLLSVAALAASAAVASAQCVAPAANQSFTNVPFISSTTFIGAPDPVYGANLYFDLAVNQTITLNGFFVNTYDAGGATGSSDVRGQIGELELWSIPGTALGQTAVGNGGTVPATPPGWTSHGRVQAVIQDLDQPTGGALPAPVVLAPGTYGFAVNYLQIIAGQTNAGDPVHPLYTNPNTSPVPLVNSDQFVTVSAVGSQGVAWTSGLLTRVINLQLDYTIQPNSAYYTKYGAGCYDRKQSFYESFQEPGAPGISSIDLASAQNGLDMFFLGDNYIVTNNAAPGLLVAPGSTVGAIHVNTGAPALSGSATQPWDDATSGPITIPFTFNYPGDGGVGSTVIDVSSNGIVYFETATRTFGFYDDYTGFLGTQPGIAGAWGDLEPADLSTFLGGQGDIWVDFDPLNQFVAITWDGCKEWQSTTNPNLNLNTIQIVLNNGGSVNIRYGAAGVNFTEAPVLVGFTPGNGAPDPGTGVTPRQAPDLSVASAGAGFLSGNGDAPAVISVGTRPAVGAPLTLTTTTVEPSVVANITVISAASLPGIDLSILGMGGCAAWVSLPELASLFQIGPPPYVWPALASIPAAFVGTNIYAQSVQFSISVPPFNAANMLVSDAVCMHFDLN
ncbi:MAG: hypothetical protein AB7O97_06760 [Planctomycetota bacterium]